MGNIPLRRLCGVRDDGTFSLGDCVILVPSCHKMHVIGLASNNAQHRRFPVTSGDPGAVLPPDRVSGHQLAN